MNVGLSFEIRLQLRAALAIWVLIALSPAAALAAGNSSMRTADSQRVTSEKTEVIVVDIGGKDGERRPIIAGGGVHFTDCPEQEGCPQMLVVPTSRPGTMIGSPPDEAGHRATEKMHAVTIKAFAIGRFEVSVAEYKACVADGGCRPPEWLEPGGQHNVETGVSGYYRNYGASVTQDRQPVVGVSYDDAVAYALWLSGKTGKAYRLLSEAEWEYAARAGTTTAYWWGNDIQHLGKAMANCQGCGSEWDAKALAPVDAFQSNPWGLYNVHGNVWEWVADFYCEHFETGPADGSPRTADDCSARDAPGLRVLRSGSTFYDTSLSRAAIRLRNHQGFRNISVGFRVGRSFQ